MLQLAEIVALLSGWLTPALLILVAAAVTSVMGLLVADLIADRSSQKAWREIGSNEMAGLLLHATAPTLRIDAQYGAGKPDTFRPKLPRSVDLHPAIQSNLAENVEHRAASIPVRPMPQELSTKAGADDASLSDLMPSTAPATSKPTAAGQQQYPTTPKISLVHSISAPQRSSRSCRRRYDGIALRRTSRSAVSAVPVQAVPAAIWPRRYVSSVQRDIVAPTLPERDHHASTSVPSDPDIRGPPSTRRANRARSLRQLPDDAQTESRDWYRIVDDLGDSTPVTNAEIDAIETYLADDLRDLLGVSANEPRQQSD